MPSEKSPSVDDRADQVERNVTGVASGSALTAKADIEAGRAGPGRGDAARNVEAARAAAAADRLRQDCTRPVAAGDRIAGQCRGNRHGRAAAAAAAAQADPDGAAGRAADADPAGHVEPAGAAAAADRLGDEAARIVAFGRDRTRTCDDDVRAAAAAARSAETDADGAARGAPGRNAAGDIEAARAAAAADRLDQHAARLVAMREDIVANRAGDRPAGPGAAARSAKPDSDADRRRAAEIRCCR